VEGHWFNIMSLIYFLDKHTWIPNLIASVVAFSIAVWQIGRQFKNTVRSQRASKLDELHLKIYEQIADTIEEFGNALAQLNSIVQALPYNIENKILSDADAKKLGLPNFVNVRERGDDFNTKSTDVNSKYLKVLSVIDKYELAFTNFGTMRIEIHKKFEEFSNAYLEFISSIYIYLPVDVEKEDQARLGIKVYPALTPDANTIRNMKTSSQITCELITDLMAYIHDLREEAQNTLISHIFDGNKVNLRNPPDPTLHKVLTVDKNTKRHLIAIITLLTMLFTSLNAHAADFLGATVLDQQSPPEAASLGITGIVPVITDIKQDSPAQKMGLKQGDIVLSFDFKSVTHSDELSHFIGTAKKIQVWHNGQGSDLWLPSTLNNPNALNQTNHSTVNSPILRIETGQHTSNINQISVDESGNWLVSSSDDKTIRVWNLKSRKLERVIRPPSGIIQSGKVNAVAISPDGKFIASGVLEKDSVESLMLFDRQNGRLFKKISSLGSAIDNLIFSPNGNYLVTLLAKGGVRIFRVEGSSGNGKAQVSDTFLRLIAQDMDYSFIKVNLGAVAFSNDSSKLAVSGYDGYLRLYKMNSIKRKVSQPQKIQPIAKNKAGGWIINFSPDGKKIAASFGHTKIDILSSRDLSFLYSPDMTGLDWNGPSVISSIAWSQNGNKLYASGVFKNSRFRQWYDEGRGTYVDLKLVELASGMKPLPNGDIAFYYGMKTGIIESNHNVKLFIPISSSNLLDASTQLLSALQLSHDGDGIKIPLWSIENHAETYMFSVTDRNTLQSNNTNTYEPADNSSVKIDLWDHSNFEIRNILGTGYIAGYAIAPDGSSFLTGTFDNLYRLDVAYNKQWVIPVQATVTKVNISKNGRIAVATLGDGTIRWYDYSTGRELLAFFPHADRKRWVLWTPEGFFDHSPGGEELIGWHLNQGKDKEALFFPASKLYKEFYRPDLVTASFESKDLSAYAKAIDINKILSRETIPPTVHFLTKSGNADNYDTPIRAQVCDTGGGIGDVTLFLNTMPVAVETTGRGLKIVEKNRDGQCYSFERTITLSPGANSIQLMAYNKANAIESHRDTIELNHTAKAAQPELHLLTVAVNAYRDGDLRLKYALPDADALAEQVQAKGKGLFNKVHLHTLRDGDVTKERLAKTFADIGSKMKREDVFLLFVAGHGITDEKEGAYYFLPADFRYTGEGAVQKQGVSMTDFRNMLANVQAMKSLILLDTCNSGSFADAIASRGMTEKTAITKLSRAVGRATIVASSKSQVALEGYEGHGAFTWTLLEGMKGKAADQGGKITINTLATFIEEELPKLTFKKWGYEQIPQKTLQGMDFQIGVN